MRASWRVDFGRPPQKAAVAGLGAAHRRHHAEPYPGRTWRVPDQRLNGFLIDAMAEPGYSGASTSSSGLGSLASAAAMACSSSGVTGWAAIPA
jgi:hypothetical protein